MKIGFILDRLSSLKEWKDTSILIMRAAAAKGHEVHAIPHSSISHRDNELVVEDLKLEIRQSGSDWYGILERNLHPWPAGEPIVIRKDPPFDMGYMRFVQVLDLASRAGLPVYNSPAALLRNDEKLLCLNYPELTPRSLVTADKDLIRTFHAEHGGCVLKPLGLMGGRGVYLSQQGDPNLDSVSQLLTAGGQIQIMVQERIVAAAEGDKRVIIVDGQVQPYMVRRMPSANDFRGNLDAGAEAVVESLGEAERAAAQAVAADLQQMGIVLAGIDLLGDRLTEINITSPTCMREIKDQAGHDCSEEFIRCIEQRSRLR